MSTPIPPLLAPSLLVLADLVALVGGTVHTMVPGEEPRVATVLIDGEHVKAIGPDLELPPGTTRYDVTGKHVVPGLIDNMVHFDADHDALYVAAGITAVRDVGSDRVKALAERFPEARDRTPGPALYTAGAVLDGDPPSSREAAVVRTVGAADQLLPILFEDQVDFLSFEPGLAADVWRHVIDLAHARDYQVWGPMPQGVSLHQALEAGQDGIFYMDGLLPDQVDWQIVQETALVPAIKELAASKTPLVPLVYPLASRFLDQSKITDILRMLSPTYHSWWLGELEARNKRLTDQTRKVGEIVVEKQHVALKGMFDAGVHLVPGSGAPHPWLLPGQALHLELSEWESAGIPPADILRAATHDAAEALGAGSSRGSIAPGMIADLVCVDQDPTVSVKTLRSPSLVVVRGKVLERSDLDDMLASLTKRMDAERKALAAPIQLEPPPTPDGALVLEGRVVNSALGQRLSEEVFRVARADDGSTTYVGRTGYPRTPDETPREMLVSQTTDPQGRLQSFRVELHDGEHVLQCDGLWSASSLQLKRSLDGKPLESKTFQQRPVCVDVTSVTTLLVLAQRDLDRPFPVISLHESLEAEPATWAMELDDHGDHQVRTHVGRLAFRLDEKGGIDLARSAVGAGIVETKQIEENAFGGPGLPLPPSKQARIDSLRAAAAAKAAREAADGTHPPQGGADGSGDSGGAGGDQGGDQGTAGGGDGSSGGAGNTGGGGASR